MDGPRGGSYGHELSQGARPYKRQRAAPKKKRRTVSRAKTTSGRSRRTFGWAPSSLSTQIINPRSAQTLRYQKRQAASTIGTAGVVTGAGAGTPFPYLYSPSTLLAPQSATYRTLFNKMKVNSIKLIFELQTLEESDDSLIPNINIRYNHDPDLSTAGFGLTYFMQINDTVKKTLTQTDNILEYTIYPQVMTGGLQTPAGLYMPMPRSAGWIDTTQDITLYGAQVYFAPFGASQQILCSAEWDITWAEPK